MMDSEQTAGSCPASGQAAVRTWMSSSNRGPTSTPAETVSRFHGDGVRYKAKLIGVDAVAGADGEKMCWDSMMKLKGLEEATRKQGKHKQRIWLKVSSGGVKIVDERSGAVQHDHERSRISSLTKDKSDPRALAYIYQEEDTHNLFYIKTANLADPVLDDIREVCEKVDAETPQDPAETPTQNSTLLVLSDMSTSPSETSDYELFSQQPDCTSEQINQSSSSKALMEVFAIQLEEPQIQPSQASQPIPPSQATQPEPPQPALSNSQILSMYSAHPAGGSPYASPPYSPTTPTMTWPQQGFVQAGGWGTPPVAPWPTLPGGGGQHGAAMMGGIAGEGPASPSAAQGYNNPHLSAYPGHPGAAPAPTSEHNLIL